MANSTVAAPLEGVHNMGEAVVLPKNMEILSSQAGGHFDNGKSYCMLKQDGMLFKPITKQDCGDREIAFYEELEKTTDPTLTELKKLVPKYYGTETVQINDKKIKCIVLDDITQHYKEPCVMDVKIGRRTWDPLASREKILNKERKYVDCKRDLGFYIPGFQVYRVKDNRLCKYGKDYGKKLDKNTVRDAMKTFLNADPALNRNLVVQFLAILWRIQKWARHQRAIRLYSSSLLLVYDARRLKEQFAAVNPPMRLKTAPTNLYRPLSLAVLNSNDRIPTGFSGQLTHEGPILTNNAKAPFLNLSPPANNSSAHPWQKSIKMLRRTHSFQHNYDKDVQNRKLDYTHMLDDLVDEIKPELWTTVKMIDFAHVFPAENNEIDANYLDGVENLVKLFEEFLMETNA